MEAQNQSERTYEWQPCYYTTCIRVVYSDRYMLVFCVLYAILIRPSHTAESHQEQNKHNTY